MFAPSQVAALDALVGGLAAISARFAAIGETTAAALRAAGVSGVAVAGAPTPEGLANAVRAVYPLRP
jgi:uroporphyrinogen-III synthase